MDRGQREKDRQLRDPLRERPRARGPDRLWRRPARLETMHDPGAVADGPAVAWHGHDKAGNDEVLFETTWANPLPLVEIASIDLVSAMTDAAPFLVAVTAQ